MTFPQSVQNSSSGLAGAGRAKVRSGALPRTDSPGVLKGEMLYRPLGRTGIDVSAIGIGGCHLGKPGIEEAVAVHLIQASIDRGITFLDNAWDYHDGQSEIRMGRHFPRAAAGTKSF
jgi:hypothetical protein